MSNFDDLALSIEVLEVMELIGEGVMCPTCVFLHIKPLKLSPGMACRPMFYPIIGKVQWARAVPATSHTTGEASLIY